ncbi:MAG: thioredoxin [Erysipelotrichaceae bacterium]|nr:thioredoxin [Erysipelotrichaceae bacterium]
MAARKIVLVATSAHKADAICKTICGPITEEVPASVLQKHPDVTIIVDEAAAALLPKEEVKVEVLNTEVFDDVVREGTVLVDFFATWCGPCKMLGPVLEQLAPEYGGKVRFYKVDCDNDPALAQRFGVTSIPNLVILKDGQLFSRSIGFASKDQLKAFLDSAL